MCDADVDCSADFFQPTQRLSSEQTQELIAFLYRARPEVERGRFGFAQWLSRHGPRFIQALPHGVLVELVQLLLNNKLLQFRKGRVSVTAPNLAPASAASLLPLAPASSAARCSSVPANEFESSCTNGIGRPSHAGDGRRVGTVTTSSLMAVPFVSAPSDRAFIPASILPFSVPFNAIELLSSLCSLRRVVLPSTCRQYPSHLPLYHHETTNSPTSSSSATWVAVCTVVLRGDSGATHNVARQFKSTQHESKDAAGQESARRALQDALWQLCFDRCVSELRQQDNAHREGESRQQRQLIRAEEQQRAEHEERHQQQTADSVTQLDRHLAFLSQPAIVYSLQPHVVQDTVGARTLWQARGQVMLEGQLLPSARVRVRAWNGCELTLSSTPVVSYAAEARKTQATALVSQQLINKLAAVASQPTPHTPQFTHSVPHHAPKASAGPFKPRSAAHGQMRRTEPLGPADGAFISNDGVNAAWQPSTARIGSTRSGGVSLTSSTLFAFPSCSDIQRQTPSRPWEYDQRDEYGDGWKTEDGEGKGGEDRRSEGEQPMPRYV